MNDTCPACRASLEAVDNFCRHCGLAAEQASATLPVARSSASITLWRPQASPVVKGAAVLAAGTLGQIVARRALTALVGGDGGQRKRKFPGFGRKQQDDLRDEAQIITETMMVRRVRIRRPS